MQVHDLVDAGFSTIQMTVGEQEERAMRAAIRATARILARDELHSPLMFQFVRRQVAKGTTVHAVRVINRAILQVDWLAAQETAAAVASYWDKLQE